MNLGTSFEKLARSRSVEIPRQSFPSAQLSRLHRVRRRRDHDHGSPGPLCSARDSETHSLAGRGRRTLFSPAAGPATARSSSASRTETIVLCYTGNVHSANARDVRSLYLAAAILDREGTPARLVRTGRDFCPFLGPDEEWAQRDFDRAGPCRLPGNPGDPQPRRRRSSSRARTMRSTSSACPGKLPEFFAMGRPVIVPQTNVGRFVRHGEEAWVLDKVDALGIVEAVLELRANKDLSERLGRRVGVLPETFRLEEKRRRPGGILRGNSLPSRKNTRMSQPLRLLNNPRQPRPPSSRGFPESNAGTGTSYATVRDYCESLDELPQITALDGDLKNVQRPWAVKAMLANVPPPLASSRSAAASRS